jgi:hypothetical protein
VTQHISKNTREREGGGGEREGEGDGDSERERERFRLAEEEETYARFASLRFVLNESEKKEEYGVCPLESVRPSVRLSIDDGERKRCVQQGQKENVIIIVA